jgi:NAD(P) transhydrogenase subunit beta
MTSVPQLVAAFNGLDAGASMLVAGAALEEALLGGFCEEINVVFSSFAALAALIGTLSLSGSAIAFGKLQGLVAERPVLIPGRHVINGLLLVVCLGVGVWLVLDPTSSLPFWLLAGVAAVLGIMLVLPIGGADMPVVIALGPNGLAAAGSGWSSQ